MPKPILPNSGFRLKRLRGTCSNWTLDSPCKPCSFVDLQIHRCAVQCERQIRTNRGPYPNARESLLLRDSSSGVNPNARPAASTRFALWAKNSWICNFSSRRPDCSANDCQARTPSDDKIGISTRRRGCFRKQTRFRHSRNGVCLKHERLARVGEDHIHPCVND